MKNLLSQTKEAYSLSLTFLGIAIWLVAIPVCLEAAQHLIEYFLGMFQSDDGIQAGTEKTLRLVAGWLKVLSLIFITVIMSRYFLHGNNLQKALKFDPSAIRSSIGLILFTTLLLVFIFYGAPYFSLWLAALDIGLSEKMIKLSPALLIIALIWPSQRVYLNSFASILEDENPIPISKQATNYFASQSFVLMILVIGPSMVLHYYLNGAAIDKVFAIQAILLLIDSFLVGLMSVLIGASTWIVYRDARSTHDGSEGVHLST